MLEPLLQQTTIPLLEQVTAFGQRRHQVLAGNIANIDTPDYKTRDLSMPDFEQALQRAVQTRRENLSASPAFPPLLADTSVRWSPATSGILPGYFPQAVLPGVSPAPQNIADCFPESLKTASVGPARNLTFPDGGNRSIERESMEMNKNTSMQSFAIEVMMSQIRLLETVISERVT